MKNCTPSIDCRNPSLGLATKARACKGVSQERSLRVTSHALRILEECEEMNLSSTLRVGVLQTPK